MLAQPDQRVEPVFGRLGPQVGEPAGGRLGERRVEDVGERGALPQREGFGEQLGRAGVPARGQLTAAVGGEPFEPLGVDVGGRQREPVAARPGFDRHRQRLAQPRDQRLQGVRGVGRRSGAPEPVDERVGRDRAPGVQREPGQEHAEAGAADVDRGAVVLRRTQRAQQRNAHAHQLSRLSLRAGAEPPRRADGSGDYPDKYDVTR